MIILDLRSVPEPLTVSEVARRIREPWTPGSRPDVIRITPEQYASLEESQSWLPYNDPRLMYRRGDTEMLMGVQIQTIDRPMPELCMVPWPRRLMGIIEGEK